MTATQQLHSFIIPASKHEDFKIARSDLARDFKDVFQLLLGSGWLTEGYQKRFLCPECGAMHKIHKLRDRLLLGCDVDENSGPIELDREDLLSYSFSASKFVAWLSKQLGLPEEIEKVGNDCWYLGQLGLSGLSRKVYFTTSQIMGTIPKSPGRIILVVGENQHQEFNKAVNLLSLLSVNQNGFRIDRKQLLSKFSKHLALDGLVIKINDHLMLNQTEDKSKKSTLHFGKLARGRFEHVVSIKPQAFNIVYFLYKLPFSNSKKSSAELENQQGLAKRRRTITVRIKEVNDILENENFPKLILTDSDNKHCIDPDLLT